MPYIQNANADNYYNLAGISYMAPGAVIWVSQTLYDNSAVIAAALVAGEIIDYEGVGAPQPDAIPHQFETEFQMSIRSGATATNLKLQFLESLGGFEDSDGNLYDAGDTFITFRAELVDNNGNYLLWEGLQGEDPGDGSICLTLTNDANFKSGQSYPSTLGSGVGEYDLTDAVVDNFIVTAEVSGGGGAYQQIVTVAKSGGDFTSIQAAIDSANPIVHSGTAQAGAAATITLAAAASAVNDYYNGMKVRLTGGTGSGQIRTIIDYVGSTKVATVDSNWTVNPDATTTYAVKSPITILYYPGEYKENITLKDCVDIIAIDFMSCKILGYIKDNNIACYSNLYISMEAITGMGLHVQNANSIITVQGNLYERAGAVVNLLGGRLTIKNAVITAIEDDDGANGITISGGTLILQNVEISCTNADAKSIYATTAQTVYVSNITANRPKHNNIILIGDVFGVGVPKANTITVAKSGGMFTTIQAAIDSANPIVHSGTAQAGAAGTITLATTASAVNDFYNGMKVRLTGGTGSGQIRTIIDYVGSTKVATVDSNWTINPDATTTYAVKSIKTVSVYSGEYDEAITLKDCVDVIAVDPEGTKILQQVIDNNVACDCYLKITMYSLSGHGIQMQNQYSNIIIKGNISALSSDFFHAAYIVGGKVTIYGDLFSVGGHALYALSSQTAVVTLYGNSQSLQYDTIVINSNADVKIYGNIVCSAANEALNFETSITGKCEVYGKLSSLSRVVYSSGGSLLIDGDIISVTNSTTLEAVEIGTGTLEIRNGTIKNPGNQASNHGVEINGTGTVKLQNVKIVCTHASANAIYAAAAKNVYCMGVWANRDDHVNITQMITGGFNFDADVI